MPLMLSQKPGGMPWLCLDKAPYSQLFLRHMEEDLIPDGADLADLERELEKVEPPLHSDKAIGAWAQDVLARQRPLLEKLSG